MPRGSRSLFLVARPDFSPIRRCIFPSLDQNFRTTHNQTRRTDRLTSTQSCVQISSVSGKQGALATYRDYSLH